jgi:Crp-like helix-turn-helix domain
MAQHLAGWTDLLEDLTGLDRERACELVGCCTALTTRDGRRTPIPVEAALVVVESGTVLLVAPAPARAPILAFARRGELLVPPVEREALIGLGGGLIRVVDAAALEELLALGGVGSRVIGRLGAVIRDRQESLRLATVSPQRERVRGKLVQLARSHGRVRADGVRIALPLTQELLARAVGSSRETVTLAMRELRGEGFLARRGRSYVLRIQAQELDTPSRASAA